jgi:hypothetical protein
MSKDRSLYIEFAGLLALVLLWLARSVGIVGQSLTSWF